jgi:hypothetical protein
VAWTTSPSPASAARSAPSAAARGHRCPAATGREQETQEEDEDRDRTGWVGWTPHRDHLRCKWRVRRRQRTSPRHAGSSHGRNASSSSCANASPGQASASLDRVRCPPAPQPSRYRGATW